MKAHLIRGAVYGVTADNGSSEETGVQGDARGRDTTFSCPEPVLTNDLKVSYSCSLYLHPHLQLARRQQLHRRLVCRQLQHQHLQRDLHRRRVLRKRLGRVLRGHHVHNYL